MILDSASLSAPFFEQRRKKLREKIMERNVDALLVTHLVNIRYLTGFTGTAGLVLVTPNGSWFLTDFRYTGQASKQVTGMSIKEYREPLAVVAGLLTELKVKRLGFESEHVSAARLEDFRAKLGGVELSPSTGLVESIRLIKDEPEIEAIKALFSMLENVFPVALELIRPGVCERDVAIELEYRLRKLGADEKAFDFIVASGARSALPHGVASDKKIEAGDMVIMDWGAKGWGYHTDNTRTLFVGNVDPELSDIYDIVLEANRSAIGFVKPGVTVKQVDDVARSIIKDAGYGEAFGHGTGHGVGLDIHEKPTISWRDDTVVMAGMVFTIEPGIYLSGKGGTRIEDMLLVTDDGCEVLSSALPKDPVRL